ncbi:MAG: glycosyltransferase family 2 protein [Patescibacteria group bacterium]
MKVVAVMPAFHEAPRIQAAILGVRQHIPLIVVVDDGSLDGTADRAREVGALVLRHPINRGQGAALKTGTQAALLLGADIVVHVDADGQHDPSGLPGLVAPLLSGEADVVFGSRYLGVEPQGMPLSRRMLHRGIRLFNAFALGIPHRVTDPQTGLRAFHVRAWPCMDFSQDMMAHASEILRLVTTSSLRWREVPALVHYSTETLDRVQGQKAWNAFHIVWELFLGRFRR